MRFNQSFHKIQTQEDLDKLIGSLASKPDHVYHRLPQRVKDKVIEQLQEGFVENILGDAYDEVNPKQESQKSTAPKKKATTAKKSATPRKKKDSPIPVVVAPDDSSSAPPSDE